MPIAYPLKIRDGVRRAKAQGMPTKQVAELFGVSRSWVRRVVQRARDDGQTQPKPRGGFRSRKIDDDQLKRLVTESPDATLKELQDALDCGCSLSGVEKALKRLNLTYKKRRCMPPSKTETMLSKNVGSGGPSKASRPVDA